MQISFDCLFQVTAEPASGENLAQAGAQTRLLAQLEQKARPGLLIVNIGSDHHSQDCQDYQPHGIGQQHALAPITFLPPSKPICSPPSTRLTDWLSRIIALGFARRSAARRTASFTRSLISSHKPNNRKRRK